MASGHPAEIVQLAPWQIRHAGRVWSLAFQDDPMMRYVVPNPQQRARVLPAYLVSVVPYCQL